MGNGGSTDPGYGEKIGHYRIEGRLGKGGMGEVYRAHDDRLDRPVALKRIKPDPRDPDSARKRFRREARIVARLSHPAIVQVHDWVEADDGDWIVMELVEGRLLRELLIGGPLHAARVVTIAHDLAAGLAVAHQAGLVHRDLKPENVMVTPDGEVKILDFGLAKHCHGEEDPEATQISRDGQMVGTPTAMSPEQALGRPVDHRSDLFALGTLLYELLTGVLPFEGGTATETLTRICASNHAPACGVNPAVPQELSALVDHLLAKEPDGRPQTTREVVTALEKLAAALAAGSETISVTLSMSSVGAVVRTLMLSDLVDSTRLVERLGDERAAEIFHHHDRLARDLLKQYEGREIDKSDGFLLLFERPLAAVLYALAYHAALRELSHELGVELSSRVGIHVGEVVVRSNSPEDVASGAKPLEVEGLTKAMAARLMSAASAGQTLISRAVFDMGRRSAVGTDSVPTNVRWADHGRYLMKGVDEPVRIFEVGIAGKAPLVPPADSEKVRRLQEDAAPSPSQVLAVAARSRGLRWAAAGLAAGALVLGGWWWAARDEAARDPGPPAANGPAQPVPAAPQRSAPMSMAVLSFRNLTGDPKFDWLCNGLTELLWTDLAQSSEIRILGPSRLHQILEASDALGQPNLSFEQIRAIGEQGDVGAVVRGSFARVGDLLGINITIEDTANGAILKSDRFEGRGEESLFAAVDELSAAVRNHFEVDRPAESPATVKMVTTSSPEAWRYYSEGLALFRQSKLQEAALLLEQAVEIDPSFALALVDLGRMYHNLGRDALAQEYNRRAVEDPDRLPLHLRLSFELAQYGSRWSTYGRAIEGYREATRLYPDRVSFRKELGLLYAFLERYEEASEELAVLIRQGTVSTTVCSNAAIVHTAQGRFETGYRILSDLSRRQPDDWLAHMVLAWHLIHWNRLEEATERLQRAADLRPGEAYVHFTGWQLEVLREDWKRAELEAAAMAVKTDLHSRWRGAVSQARNLVYRGRSEEAVERLEDAAGAYPAPEGHTAITRCWAAELLLARGETARALAQARRAQEEGRGQWPELQGLYLAALAEEEMGHSSAADAIERTLREKWLASPNRVEERQLYHLVGRRALARGDTGTALEALRQAQGLLAPRGVAIHLYTMPDHVPIWSALGEAELTAGNPEAALTWFRKVVESGAEHIEFPVPWVRSFYFLGRIHLQRGETDAARSSFERFLGFWRDADLDRDRVEEALAEL